MTLTRFQRQVVAAIRDGHDTYSALCNCFRKERAAWQVAGGISVCLNALNRKGVISPHQGDTVDFYKAKWKVLI